MGETPIAPLNAGSSTRIGALAERAVAAHLTACGMEVVGVNMRVGRLELDVVARVGSLVVVVEVRVRGAGAWVRAIDSVDARKRDRVRRAGERLWLERFASDETAERMRFDIAAVTVEGDEVTKIEVVEGAF